LLNKRQSWAYIFLSQSFYWKEEWMLEGVINERFNRQFV
jgi:hypothetical protein